MNQQLAVLEKLIESALNQLYQEDIYLINNGVHERSIVFRFAHYLQNQMDNTPALKEYNLDFEYNKNGRFSKRIPARLRGAFPDLIVHKRGTNECNLLIIEFKTWWDSDTSKDEEKLHQFVDPFGEYGYCAGKSIVLAEVREDVKIWTCTKGSADVVL